MSDLPRITVGVAREAFKKTGLIPNTGSMFSTCSRHHSRTSRHGGFACVLGALGKSVGCTNNDECWNRATEKYGASYVRGFWVGFDQAHLVLDPNDTRMTEGYEDGKSCRVLLDEDWSSVLEDSHVECV